MGRILRSQAKRRDCYYDVVRIVQETGVEGNLDRLVKTIATTLIKLYRRFYKRAIIQQQLRTLRRYYYKLQLDLSVFLTIPYTQMVKPIIRAFIFPYAVDDGLRGQSIRMNWDASQVHSALKLPTTSQPRTRKDWQWVEFAISIAPKILGRVSSNASKIHLPTLRLLTLKGGLRLPFLEVLWSSTLEHLPALNSKRVLATDLGVIHLTTSVICEAGSQMSPPMFWFPPKNATA